MTRRRAQSGYVLVLNIGVLALLMLGAAYLGQRTEVAIQMVRSEQTRFEQEVNLSDGQARILFFLATTPRTFQGIGVGENALVPDGRLYRLDDNIAFSVQDVRGLISVNGVSLSGAGRDILERLIETYDVDHDLSVALVDALLDYRDENNLRRLNGAETEEYAAADREQDLRNADLRLPQELSRVLGWSEVAALWGDDPITNHVSVFPRPVLNPNSATWRVLVAMSGLSREAVMDLVEARRRGEIVDLTPLVAPGLSSDPFAPGPVIVKAPSEELLVSIYAKSATNGRRISLTHLPQSAFAPWKINSSEVIGAPGELASWDDIPLLTSGEEGSEDSNDNRVQLPF